MISYNRGDVILVPFPFSDNTTTKKRPSIIIGSNNYNKISFDIIIMAITSKTEQVFDIGVSLIKDWQEAGLLKPFTIKPAISTIDKKLVLKNLGRLSSDDLTSLDKTLLQYCWKNCFQSI